MARRVAPARTSTLSEIKGEDKVLLPSAYHSKYVFRRAWQPKLQRPPSLERGQHQISSDPHTGLASPSGTLCFQRLFGVLKIDHGIHNLSEKSAVEDVPLCSRTPTSQGSRMVGKGPHSNFTKPPTARRPAWSGSFLIDEVRPPLDTESGTPTASQKSRGSMSAGRNRVLGELVGQSETSLHTDHGSASTSDVPARHAVPKRYRSPLSLQIAQSRSSYQTSFIWPHQNPASDWQHWLRDSDVNSWRAPDSKLTLSSQDLDAQFAHEISTIEVPTPSSPKEDWETMLCEPHDEVLLNMPAEIDAPVRVILPERPSRNTNFTNSVDRLNKTLEKLRGDLVGDAGEVPTKKN